MSPREEFSSYLHAGRKTAGPPPRDFLREPPRPVFSILPPLFGQLERLNYWLFRNVIVIHGSPRRDEPCPLTVSAVFLIFPDSSPKARFALFRLVTRARAFLQLMRKQAFCLRSQFAREIGYREVVVIHGFPFFPLRFTSRATAAAIAT